MVWNCSGKNCPLWELSREKLLEWELLGGGRDCPVTESLVCFCIEIGITKGLNKSNMHCKNWESGKLLARNGVYLE